MRTVGEFFEEERIDRDAIEEMSGTSDYWDSASNFALKTWDDDMGEMSLKQINWLERIREDLIERRCK